MMSPATDGQMRRVHSLTGRPVATLASGTSRCLISLSSASQPPSRRAPHSDDGCEDSAVVRDNIADLAVFEGTAVLPRAISEWRPFVDECCVRSVGVGEESLCVVAQDGRLYSCGHCSFGCLGWGGAAEGQQPRLIPALKDHRFTAVAAGRSFAVALTDGGELFSWGGGFAGELGLSPPVAVASVPRCVKVPSNEYIDDGKPCPRLSLQHFPRVVAISCGEEHVLACTDTGKCLAWGSNAAGQLGLGRRAPRCPGPQLVRISGCVSDVAAGRAHSVIRADANECYAFGLNIYGQLGLGHTVSAFLPEHISQWPPPLPYAPPIPTFPPPSTVPVLPEPLSRQQGQRIVAMSASASFTLFLTHQGTVYFVGKLPVPSDMVAKENKPGTCVRPLAGVGKVRERFDALAHISNRDAFRKMAASREGRENATGDGEMPQEGANDEELREIRRIHLRDLPRGKDTGDPLKGTVLCPVVLDCPEWRKTPDRATTSGSGVRPSRRTPDASAIPQHSNKQPHPLVEFCRPCPAFTRIACSDHHIVLFSPASVTRVEPRIVPLLGTNGGKKLRIQVMGFRTAAAEGGHLTNADGQDEGGVPVRVRFACLSSDVQPIPTRQDALRPNLIATNDSLELSNWGEVVDHCELEGLLLPSDETSEEGQWVEVTVPLLWKAPPCWPDEAHQNEDGTAVKVDGDDGQQDREGFHVSPPGLTAWFTCAVSPDGGDTWTATTSNSCLFFACTLPVLMDRLEPSNCNVKGGEEVFVIVDSLPKGLPTTDTVVRLTLIFTPDDSDGAATADAQPQPITQSVLVTGQFVYRGPSPAVRFLSPDLRGLPLPCGTIQAMCDVALDGQSFSGSPFPLLIHDAHLVAIVPNLGPIDQATSVLMKPSAVFSSEVLAVRAAPVSPDTSTSGPPYPVGAEMDQARGGIRCNVKRPADNITQLTLEVSFNGQSFTNDRLVFTFHPPLECTKLCSLVDNPNATDESNAQQLLEVTADRCTLDGDTTMRLFVSELLPSDFAAVKFSFIKPQEASEGEEEEIGHVASVRATCHCRVDEGAPVPAENDEAEDETPPAEDKWLEFVTPCVGRDDLTDCGESPWTCRVDFSLNGQHSYTMDKPDHVKLYAYELDEEGRPIRRAAGPPEPQKGKKK